jgi:hypothetical protein
MEYVEGVSIDAFCDERRLSVRDRIRFLMRVMDAVAYAHQHLWRRPRLPRVPARRLKLPPVVARGGQTFYQVQKIDADTAPVSEAAFVRLGLRWT